MSTYDVWRHMIQRCTKETHPDYHNYGGRGIKVCQRWLDSFENFLADKGIKPNGLTLDRIENNGDYTPENTKWATYSEQLRNTRNSRMITYEGKTMCLTDWAKHTGLGKQTILGRIHAGWPTERLFEPSQRPKSTLQTTTLSLGENMKSAPV